MLRLFIAVTGSILLSSVALAEQICHQVWDDTIIQTMNCDFTITKGYSCPTDGSPCEELKEIVPRRKNCGRVSRLVCAPTESFQIEQNAR